MLIRIPHSSEAVEHRVSDADGQLVASALSELSFDVSNGPIGFGGPRDTTTRLHRIGNRPPRSC